MLTTTLHLLQTNINCDTNLLLFLQYFTSSLPYAPTTTATLHLLQLCIHRNLSLRLLQPFAYYNPSPSATLRLLQPFAYWNPSPTATLHLLQPYPHYDTTLRTVSFAVLHFVLSVVAVPDPVAVEVAIDANRVQVRIHQVATRAAGFTNAMAWMWRGLEVTGYTRRRFASNSQRTNRCPHENIFNLRFGV